MQVRGKDEGGTMCFFVVVKSCKIEILPIFGINLARELEKNCGLRGSEMDGYYRRER